MTITVNTKAYAFDTNQTADKVKYTGPAHTFQIKDILEMARVAPKPTPDFEGVARTSAKFTRTVTLASGLKGTAIMEVTSSIPVGMSDTDIGSLCDDCGDLTISTNGLDLVKKHDINQ